MWDQTLELDLDGAEAWIALARHDLREFDQLDPPKLQAVTDRLTASKQAVATP
ncbi:MAG: hypothetical protein ACRBN8_33855 [Nannocystales bacterium]